MKNPPRKIRLISVTREGWRGEMWEHLPALANDLLPPAGDDLPYRFTGTSHPNLEPRDIRVFRFEGKLLGEGAFLRWAPRTRNGRYRMLYQSGQQYSEPVVGSRFIATGRALYRFISEDTLRRIRAAALRPDPGPYVQTGVKQSMAKHRIGQGAVRDSALKRYGTRCCLCPIDHRGLLVAGHIQGWAKGEKARGNPGNVLLMCAFHDSLFGRGFLTLQPQTYAVRTSKAKLSVGAYNQIKEVTFKFRKPTSHPPGLQFLAWHKKHLFEA